MHFEHVYEVIGKARIHVVAEYTLRWVKVGLILGIVFIERCLGRSMVIIIFFIIKRFSPDRALFIRNTSRIVRL